MHAEFFPPIFCLRCHHIFRRDIPSVISLTLGPKDAESPNEFFGTAFGVSFYHKNEPTDFFLMCTHVFDDLKPELDNSREKTKFISRYTTHIPHVSLQP